MPFDALGLHDSGSTALGLMNALKSSLKFEHPSFKYSCVFPGPSAVGSGRPVRKDRSEPWSIVEF